MMVRFYQSNLQQVSAVGRDVSQAFGRNNIGTVLLFRMKRGWMRAPFLFYISFVMAVALIYYFLIAAPLYDSETQFGVRSKQALAPVPGLSALTSLFSSSSAPDSTAITNFINSPDMFNALDKIYDLRAAYSKLRPDLVEHIPKNSRQEDFVKFYNSMVIVVLDSDNNIVTVDVRAFDAQTARNMAKSITALSSDFATQLSSQMNDESLRSSRKDLADAQADYVTATAALTKYRSTVGNLDPTVLGAAASSGAMAMQTQIYGLQTQLASAMTYSTKSSPQVQQIQAQIKSLQDQIASTQKALTGKGDEDTVAKQMDKYETLATAQAYMQQRVLVAQAALDQTKSVSDQRELFVVPIVLPNLPDRASYPRIPADLLTVFALAATIYAICKLCFASIRDHRGV